MHMCLIRTSGKFTLLVFSELRSEAAWIWNLLSELLEGSKLQLFLSNLKGLSTLGWVPAQVILLLFLSLQPGRLLREDGILGKLFARSEGGGECAPTHLTQPSLQARSVSANSQLHFPPGNAKETELVKIYLINSLTYQH